MLPRTAHAPYNLWPDNFSKIFSLNFFPLFLTTLYIACGILVPQPGTESGTPAMEAQSLNWTTRKVPDHIIINFKLQSLNIIVVQSLSHVLLFATPWTAAPQASLSFTISWSLLRFMSTESVMLSNHLISLLPPSPFAFNLSQHQGLFQWVRSSHQGKVLELQPQHQSSQWIFRVDFL